MSPDNSLTIARAARATAATAVFAAFGVFAAAHAEMLEPARMAAPTVAPAAAPPRREVDPRAATSVPPPGMR